MRACLEFLKMALRIVVYGVGVITLLLLTPKLLKIEPSIVLSGSMEPALIVGDVIYAKQDVKSGYQIGDIIVFRYDNTTKPSAHRIIAINEDKIHTKGDNNENEDRITITSDQIDGKVVFAVPKVGFLIQKAQTKNGIIMLLSVICVNFLLGFIDLNSDEDVNAKI